MPCPENGTNLLIGEATMRMFPSSVELQPRSFSVSELSALAVYILALIIALGVGFSKGWYYGVLTFVSLAAGAAIVIGRWTKIYRVFSIQDEEAENAQITRNSLENRLTIEETRDPGIDTPREIYLKVCRKELMATTADLENQQFDLAWGRFHFVEETLLLLYPQEEVLAQLDLIATRAQELPEGKREGATKVLARAREFLDQNPQLANPSEETKFRTYLKEALAVINHHRRLFHWHRGIYQAQVYILMTFIVPLLLVFFWLRQLLPSITPLTSATLPFLMQIFILGALGGVVSLLLSERNLGEGVTSFYYGKIGLLIKPVLGAVGAVVIYYLFESKLLFHVAEFAEGVAGAQEGRASTTGVVNLTVTYCYFYYVLAFLSGFSERFFTATVARLEGRLSGQGQT
jgi:hypothetical protein